MVDGLFPPGGFRSFNIAVAFDGALRFLRSLGSALVLDVADHQPQRFQRRGIVRELAAVAGGFPQLSIQRFDRIRGVEYPPCRRWELQKWHKPVPGVAPDFDRLRVFTAQFTGLECVQGGAGGVLGRCGVDLP
ncbi:hypothetical protein FRC0184_02245 [Corynebacterium diphtheriae]|nr:hypothetical protein FRC0184_02245 [Corynebacterium diphtheriae]